MSSVFDKIPKNQSGRKWLNCTRRSRHTNSAGNQRATHHKADDNPLILIKIGLFIERCGVSAGINVAIAVDPACNFCGPARDSFNIGPMRRCFNPIENYKYSGSLAVFVDQLLNLILQLRFSKAIDSVCLGPTD